MKIMCLDPASKLGWAVHTIGDTFSGVELGTIHLEGKGPFAKVKAVRKLLPPLIKKYRPDYVAFESPLQFIPKYERTKTDIFGEDETTSTMNAGTTLMLNRISGAVQCVIEGFDIPCEEVFPISWQSVIDKRIPKKSANGDKISVKERIRMMCDLNRIVGGNQDAKDAAVMCIWAAQKSQILKQIMNHGMELDLV